LDKLQNSRGTTTGHDAGISYKIHEGTRTGHVAGISYKIHEGTTTGHDAGISYTKAEEKFLWEKVIEEGVVSFTLKLILEKRTG
jgi:hypothetical protein